MKSMAVYGATVLVSLIIGWILNDIWEREKYNFIKPLDSNYYHSFDFFYHHFAADSTFQKEHVKLPLEYTVWIMEHMELYQKENWNQWRHLDLPMDFDTILYDNYEGELKGRKRLLIVKNTFYYFEFRNDKWYLIRIEKYI